MRHLAILVVGLLATTVACQGGGADSTANPAPSPPLSAARTPSSSPSPSPTPSSSPSPSPTPSSSPSPALRSTALPAATSFDGYAVGFCSAFDALFRAVGNPDTAAGSALSKALDAAVVAHDGAAAERLAAEITAELEAGRLHAAFARGWAPGAPSMVQLDRLLVAFEAMTAAKIAAAKQTPNAVDPQIALEQAGGLEAWTALFEAYRAIGTDRPPGVQPCPTVPIAP